MELYQIRAFVSVARLGNVTKAADALHVTQPAVTAQIKGLEQDLGVALFARASGRLSLTRAGERLLPCAEALLQSSAEMQAAAQRLKGELSGRVELGVPGETPEFLRLGALLGGMQQGLPLVELRTRSLPLVHLLDQVRGGGLSCALVVAPNPPRDVQWHPLRSLSYRVAIPSRLKPEMQNWGWRSLASLPWIDGAIESHVHQMLRALFEQQGLDPNVVLRSEDTSGLDDFVRSGSGCALLREEVAVLGAEREDWMVWGAARIDAQLFFVASAERASDPLIVAMSSVIQTVWAQ
jgi:DNA-binding transcriptional LysR family regulator